MQDVMSKKKAQQQKPSLDELLEKGNITLTADSRKAVYEMGETLVGSIPEDVRWTRTAVEYNGEAFTQTYTLIQND